MGWKKGGRENLNMGKYFSASAECDGLSGVLQSISELDGVSSGVHGESMRSRYSAALSSKHLDDDKQLRSVDEEVGSLDEVATLGPLPPPPHRQTRQSPHQPCNNNPQAPNCTTDHRLQSLAQLLKVEDFACDCGVKSTSQMAHMEHILTHVICAFKCPKCNCSFATSSILVQHQRLVHSPDIPRERVLDMSRPISGAEGEMCSQCGTGVGHDFEVHARSHLYGEYECPVCALRMHTKSTTETHIERKHPHLFSAFLKNEESLRDGSSKSEEGSGTPVSCDVCGKVVATPSRLARHRYLHHPEHYPWPCSDCSLTFYSPDALNQHICPHQQKVSAKKTATGQKYKCDVCGVMLKSRVNLERHMHSHPDRIGGYHTCPICARTLTTRKALTDHLRHHRRQGFSCDFCGAKLKSMDSLNVHINELHTHVVRLQCKHCPQVFFSSGRLSYHVKRHHTDRRSYTNLCHLCGKVYPYPSELRLHLRSHRNERPYKCDQCQKSFLKQGDLTYHKRSHTGERPHKCPHCQATFPRPNTLMSHIRHHHQQSTGVGSTESAPQPRATQPPAITLPAITLPAVTLPAVTLPSVPPPAAPHPAALVSSAPPHSVAAHPAVALPPTSVSTANAPTYVTAAPATVMAVSSTPYLTPVDPSVPLQPRPPAVTVMSVPGAPRHAQPTLVPVVEGQLVDPTVEGHMTEMQAVQYVQVEGLPGHTTLQPLHPHHPPQGQYAHTQAAVPYQIVHLQILQ